ncbi:hypothetical protein [Streptomyces poonensis]|uniref:Secreted protein n=1 Tax=Streptomyces poonensis TaxID=68255 RepID=A0A918UVI8_9ACTN|nr:hypothetical protein [Streptomyces poonensis]GGZ37402.1 hypothetical protein GCM10010365_67650 [Streptomyces poonensis]GLJ91175.1 hypothetical protein GCM10017589_37810 [Streptomyces poonensis]
MRTRQLLARAALTAAAATALPLAPATPAQAGPGISVSTVGASVDVTTSACATMNADGSFGRASLLAGGQRSFAQGRQATLTGTSTAQSAAWTNVGAGTYTVTVVCKDGTTAGTQAVIVSGPPTISATALPSPALSASPYRSAGSYRSVSPLPSYSPSPSSSPSPSRGVLGGLGGATENHRTLTLLGGGALVAVGTGASVWYLRRRARPGRSWD